MDKPRFTVIENGEQKSVDRPRSEDEVWQDECEQDAILTLRRALKEAKERANGKVTGVSIAFVYEDGSVGDKHSKLSGAPAMIGALEIAKSVRINALNSLTNHAEEPKDEDE